MKAAAQPYQAWRVPVYQSSSFWSLMQWRRLKNNPIFLVHTRCKEAQKLPSSSHSLTPVTTDLCSYTWKSYTFHGQFKITPHLSVLVPHSHFAVILKGISQFPTYLFSTATLYATATRQCGEGRFWAPTACFYTHTHICVRTALSMT